MKCCPNNPDYGMEKILGQKKGDKFLNKINGFFVVVTFCRCVFGMQLKDEIKKHRKHFLVLLLLQNVS